MTSSFQRPTLSGPSFQRPDLSVDASAVAPAGPVAADRHAGERRSARSVEQRAFDRTADGKTDPRAGVVVGAGDDIDFFRRIVGVLDPHAEVAGG